MGSCCAKPLFVLANFLRSRQRSVVVLGLILVGRRDGGAFSLCHYRPGLLDTLDAKERSLGALVATTLPTGTFLARLSIARLRLSGES